MFEHRAQVRRGLATVRTQFTDIVPPSWSNRYVRQKTKRFKLPSLVYELAERRHRKIQFIRHSFYDRKRYAALLRLRGDCGSFHVEHVCMPALCQGAFLCRTANRRHSNKYAVATISRGEVRSRVGVDDFASMHDITDFQSRRYSANQSS